MDYARKNKGPMSYNDRERLKKKGSSSTLGNKLQILFLWTFPPGVSKETPNFKSSDLKPPVSLCF